MHFKRFFKDLCKPLKAFERQSWPACKQIQPFRKCLFRCLSYAFKRYIKIIRNLVKKHSKGLLKES